MGTQTASQYITVAGHQALKAEFERLWRRERPLVTKALGEAAAEGDRSENAEYIYRKKQLREMDRRIRYLSKRLDVLQVVSERPRDVSRVFFAARVTLEDAEGRRRDFQLVGADETLAEAGRISIDSPMARALLGRRVGDVVVVQTPRGDDEYEVLEIEYPDPEISSYV
ncbi:MAG: transcription elongation factor GreB [Pseudomonadota bacterium]